MRGDGDGLAGLEPHGSQRAFVSAMHQDRMLACPLNHFRLVEVQVLLVHRNSHSLRIFCSQRIARMCSESMKSLLIFIWVGLSDKEHMIRAGIANRGKSFLALIVLALFIFGVIQMLTSA